MSDKEAEAFQKWYQVNKPYLERSSLQDITNAYHAGYESRQLELDQLEMKLWQALGAMGYPVPGHIPEGEYTCGLCESRSFQIAKKDAQHEALMEVIRILSNNRSA